MAKKLSSLSLENKVLKRNKLLGKGNFSFFSWRRIKTDAKMNFYTGITTVAGFHSIFSLIEPSLPSINSPRAHHRLSQPIEHKRFEPIYIFHISNRSKWTWSAGPPVGEQGSSGPNIP